jgi:hypothetical protein
LGCITNITRGRNSLPELVVALPDNLIGYVNISEISDELIQEAGDSLPDLEELFFVGQWVQCVIIGLQQGASGGAAASGTDKQRRKIFLSLKPFIVNAGIKSIDIASGTVWRHGSETNDATRTGLSHQFLTLFFSHHFMAPVDYFRSDSERRGPRIHCFSGIAWIAWIPQELGGKDVSTYQEQRQTPGCWSGSVLQRPLDGKQQEDCAIDS